MKRLILPFVSLVASLMFSLTATAQTVGALTFSFTPTSHTGFAGTKNVLAVWIQTSAGGFVKTKMRYVGSGTKDHLGTWATNSGGAAGNALGAGCNVVSATTGATLQTFSTKTITWDGTDVSGNIVPDGTYKVTIQSTWGHNAGQNATKSFTFTKGPSSDIQSPADDANFTAVSLQWLPSQAGVEETNVISGISIYPNPSYNGLITVEYEKATSIEVVNALGEQVFIETLAGGTGKREIDLSSYPSGVYFVSVANGDDVFSERVVIE